jgi:hypothetical protein
MVIKTYRDRLILKDLNWRIIHIENKWGVGDDFVFGIVTRGDYGKIMMPLKREARRDFRRQLGYSDQCMTHLEERGYVAQYLEGGSEVDRLRARMMNRSQSLSLKSVERRECVNYPRPVIHDVSRQMVVPRGELENFLFGELGVDAFREYKSGKMDGDLSTTVSELLHSYMVPHNPQASNLLRRGKVSYIS